MQPLISDHRYCFSLAWFQLNCDIVDLRADGSYDGVITSEGLKGKVVYNEPLSQILTLHAVISNTNPNAEAYLKTLDDSLLKMKATGEWFNILRRHLSDFRAANAFS